MILFGKLLQNTNKKRKFVAKLENWLKNYNYGEIKLWRC